MFFSFAHVHFLTIDETEDFLKQVQNQRINGPHGIKLTFSRSKKSINNTHTAKNSQRFHATSADLAPSSQSIISPNGKSNGTSDFPNCKRPSDQDSIFNESPLDQDSVFNKDPKTSHVISLGYNLYDINESYLLKVNTPGIEKSSDLEFFIGDNDDQITIQGNSKLLEEGSNPIIRLLPSIFKIQVDLPSKIDVSRSSNVTVRNGVTTISLRKFIKRR
ncbi:10117_t:CDS:2, partial [Funneliformis caledonium]